MSREAVSKWEQNRGVPSEASLEEVSKFYGINKEELLNNDDVNQMLENKDKIIIKEKRKLYILTEDNILYEKQYKIIKKYYNSL